MTNEIVAGEVKAVANYVGGTAEYLMRAGPAVGTVVLCIGLGYILKALPFPNRYIPVTVWITGGFIFPALVPTGSIPPTVRNPMLLAVIIGLVMGFLAWGIHRVVLRKLLDDRWFRPDGETMIIQKETVTIEQKAQPKAASVDPATPK